MERLRIPHSKPFLPPVEVYQAYISDIWDRGWLTNHGPLVQQFEAELSTYLGIAHASYVSSGTTGLQCALRTLQRGGEVITTPFSYVATAGSIFWEGFTPVFADIEPGTLGPDPEGVEGLINSRTRAILATHVYGVPCQVDALSEIAQRHELSLIFDAAHCFGTTLRGRSVLSYGDISILSLHATKLFHTANGGLVVSASDGVRQAIEAYRNFGHDGPNHFPLPGINGKNSELHAGLGLTMMPYADHLLKTRRGQWDGYKKLLSPIDPDHLLHIPEGTGHNGAYFPILHLPAKASEHAIKALYEAGIEARRYFNPALNTIGYMRGAACPVAERTAGTVFCLPMHTGLTAGEQEEVAHILLSHI